MISIAINLRDWLSHLDATGRLKRVNPKVRLARELAAISKKPDRKTAVLFESTDGPPCPWPRMNSGPSSFPGPMGWTSRTCSV